ncbi:L10-interacting MYB domain-containing protein-like [Cornus florida]|uniref:L10-interacting MYB domain-containing protein-like n=1 Tax=Cornus florida TaxID=4283 RepID=UPI0028A1DC98|nr:L10-interacting MYB domain-containing protein-like [Cornus florida]
MASQIVDIEESALWSTQLERCFVDIMVEEVNKGNMPSGIFTSKCWKKIAEEFKNKTNHAYNVKQLKAKFNRLRTKHHEFSTLLNETTGFGWDAETNTVIADEETWQTYLRAYPNAKCFRKKSCENYKLLGVLFNTSTATGQLHYASTQDPPNTDEEQEQEDQFMNTGVHVSSTAECQDDLDNILVEDNNPRRRESTSSDHRAKKVSKKDSISDTLGYIVEASKARIKTSLAKAERYKKMKHTQKATSPDAYSLSNCIECLEGLDEIDDDTYLKATETFKELHYRELFIKMSISRKFAWLKSLD